MYEKSTIEFAETEAHSILAAGAMFARQREIYQFLEHEAFILMGSSKCSTFRLILDTSVDGTINHQIWRHGQPAPDHFLHYHPVQQYRPQCQPLCHQMYAVFETGNTETNDTDTANRYKSCRSKGKRRKNSTRKGCSELRSYPSPNFGGKYCLNGFHSLIPGHFS
ncbi:hypothetical protein CEXT_806831 [Caerostris extrusa]|uniref:Uncharacterized protein n=1 Tax=Caerostris extrusa TaxID=172846 RepID=A0AAV4VE94_CAEEX|nr:hypothetical protein CEXT_186601 [Caerostris extrusa]GIY98493.1 hypothetical protein CEXT_806831 [Caerostris extrusa]